MVCKRIGAVAAAVILVLSWFVAAAPAVQIYPEDQEFWDAYKKARELRDDKEVERLARRMRKNVAGVLECLTTSLCQKEIPEEVQDFEYLARVFAEVGGSKNFIHRLDFLKSLTQEQRSARIVAGNELYYGNTKMLDAQKAENVYTFYEAKDHYAKALAGYTEIGDTEMMASTASLLAQCCQGAKEHYDACVALATALAAMDALPYPNPDKKWAKDQYDKYIAAGFDPTKPKNEGGEPEGGMPEAPVAGEGETGEQEAAEQKPAEAVEFQYEIVAQRQMWPLKYTEMKKPEEFVTPSYEAADQHYLWASATVQGDENQQFKPGGGAFPLMIYGKQINVQRDRLKLTFDVNGEPGTQQTISIKDRPGDLCLKTNEKDSEGKPIDFKLFVCHPGTQETIFMLNTNLAPQEKWMVVRCRTGCYFKGKAADDKFIIIDDNTSGIYGDNMNYPRDGVTFQDFEFYRCDAVVAGKAKKAAPWSQIMKIGEKWYFLDVDRNGIQVGTTEVKIATGTVRVAWDGGVVPAYLILRGLDPNGQNSFFDVMGEGKGEPVEIPAGKYHVACGKIISGAKNKLQQIRIYNGKMEPIVVRPGQETAIELGAPFTYTWEGGPFGQNFTITGRSIMVFGRSGELYSSFWDEIPVPLVSIRAKDSKKLLVRQEAMALATLDDWYENQFCAWYPKDFTVENKTGETLEVRLETKKHPVLGGPIAGDWK